MATFDYAAYYRRLQDLKKLQIPTGAVRWTERYEPPDRSYAIVLYLGCNILRTPDVAADVVAVFEALGLDFIAVAGVQFCCGITWDRFGDVAKGQNVSANTIQRLASYNPRAVVHWCPSCDVHFSDVVTGRDANTLPFEVTNTAAFLSDLSRRGLLPWRTPLPGRLVLHSHRGRGGHETGQRRARADRLNVSHLLQQLPGAQFLGAVDAPPEYDYDCGPGSLRLERSRWLEIRAELLAETRRRGADTLVTVSHACQREWCDTGDDTLAVRNYISLIAEALGCARTYETNTLGQLKHLGDPQTIVERTQANWSSHGLTERQALRLARRYSWSPRAPRSVAP
jgi:heterodisulfide reductase subunit D